MNGNSNRYFTPYERAYTRQLTAPVGWLSVLASAAFASHAMGIGYEDFPPNLQAILNERIAILNTDGGVCIAGRVQFSDGAPINSGKVVQVNLLHGIDEPLRIYPGGWFIGDSVRSAFYAGPDRTIVHRAFTYDPLDASVTVLDGEMTFLESVMQRTPVHQLVAIVGTVRDENGDPFPGARIVLSYPYAYLGTSNRPDREAIADDSGEFVTLQPCAMVESGSGGIFPVLR